MAAFLLDRNGSGWLGRGRFTAAAATEQPIEQRDEEDGDASRAQHTANDPGTDGMPAERATATQ